MHDTPSSHAVAFIALGATGLRKDGVELLQPQNYHGAIKQISGSQASTSIVLDSPAVIINLSQPAVVCLVTLAKEFMQSTEKGPAGEHQPASGKQGSGSTPAASGKGIERQRVFEFDDLRCGLFERTQVAASRPG